MLDINGGEFVVIALLVALLLGPDRLPELARQAARLIRRGRDFATGASSQMKDEMGVDLDGVDWRRYDPRQYHPKRIVRNALSDAFDDEEPARSGSTAAGKATPRTKPGAAASAAKRAEAARPVVTSETSGPGAGSAGQARPTSSTSSTSPRRASPPPTTWAEAARRAGVDDDAT